MRSFHSFGFDRLAIDTLQSSYRNTDDLSVPSSMTYRLGWRTETWDLPAQTQYTSGASLYQCLRAIYRERDQTAVDSEVRQALCREMSRLRDLGPENIIEIRPETQQRLEKRQVLSDHWNEFVDIDFAFGFSDLENVMATRLALVRSVRKREERQQIGNLIPPFTLGLIDVEKRSLLRLSEAARKANLVQVALNAVVRAQMLEKEPSFDVSHEFAHVLWLQREEKLSVQYLLKLVRQDDDKAESEISSERKALLLSRLVGFIVKVINDAIL
ncbi:hypothetical protein BDQ17DRAFT_336266 [Cyathus striatus]|nr:hypothetical protein BDQ17DRAFT_336266 [Cyathus striatus]